jgi:hypothetical protein
MLRFAARATDATSVLSENELTTYSRSIFRCVGLVCLSAARRVVHLAAV